MHSTHPGATNLFLAALPKKVQEEILAQGEIVDLSFGEIVYEADQPLHFLYFPLLGFFSLLATMDGHEPLEMGLIGDEGMLGATLAIDIETTSMQVIVQGSGKALRLTALQMRGLLQEHPALTEFLTCYMYVQQEQLIQSANCRYFHAIQPRLIRWLLMSHDRAHSDTLELTQKFIARMLGVRRSGVTVAARDLLDRGLINYRRGQIEILNRKGLEALSCECYGNMQRIYARHFGR